MTEEQIKEQLSISYLGLLAGRSGYKSTVHTVDHGVDVTISKARFFEGRGRRRLLDCGQFIEVQLKCTCEASITSEAENVKYDLKAKNYNDLIDRLDTPIPLFLVLMVLPDDKESWVSLRGHEIALAKCAYWYRPDDTDTYTSNSDSTRISIPKSNSLDMEFLNRIFSEFYP